jgi:hypothetical protein
MLPINTNGYLKNSPNRFNKLNIIPNKNITMNNVNIPLLLKPNKGKAIIAMPNSGNYNFPKADFVTELPLKKYTIGGEDPRDNYYKNSAIVMYSKNLLNKKLQEKYPNEFNSFYDGLKKLPYDKNKRNEYINNQAYNNYYLNNDEIKSTLGQHYNNYVNASKFLESQDNTNLKGNLEQGDVLFGFRRSTQSVTPELWTNDKLTKKAVYDPNKKQAEIIEYKKYGGMLKKYQTGGDLCFDDYGNQIDCVTKANLQTNQVSNPFKANNFQNQLSNNNNTSFAFQPFSNQQPITPPQDTCVDSMGNPIDCRASDAINSRTNQPNNSSTFKEPFKQETVSASKFRKKREFSPFYATAFAALTTGLSAFANSKEQAKQKSFVYDQMNNSQFNGSYSNAQNDYGVDPYEQTGQLRKKFQKGGAFDPVDFLYGEDEQLGEEDFKTKPQETIEKVKKRITEESVDEEDNTFNNDYFLSKTNIKKIKSRDTLKNSDKNTANYTSVTNNSSNSIQAQVTRYGMVGDPNQNKKATVNGSKHENLGNRNNLLEDGVSVALSPEFAKQLGVNLKAGEYVEANINGKWERFRVDDNTAKGLRNYRIDFYDPNGKRKAIDGNMVQVRKASYQEGGTYNIDFKTLTELQKNGIKFKLL